jgi:mannose-6-phosphate isomerase-like protein (cupin superfamily)
MSDYAASQFDASVFLQDAYIKRIEKPWGYELHWTPADKPYMGKILHINAGSRLSLQAHNQKQESWIIMNGQAKVIWENSAGELSETELVPGKGYTCAIGQRHRLAGVTDCDVIEVSTPELGTTWRLDDDYARPDETEEQRAKERGEV